MKIVTITINKKKLTDIKKHYRNFIVDNNNEYIVFCARKNDLSLNVFSNKKNELFKAVFSGDDALKEALLFDKNVEIVLKNKPSKESKYWLCLENQIGSDEVGTGDFFGPICVCAALIKENDIEFLRQLKVDDSKKLTDENIKMIAPLLIKRCHFSQVSVDNEKYNDLINNGYNMNAIKARLHNQALLNLSKQNPQINNIFVDQFCSPSLYYKYIAVDKERLKGITFREKGESAYPSVAVGSIIARYSFLLKMETIGKKYHMNIPFGAGTRVNDFAINFIKKYGKNELIKIVKTNFKNLQEIINKIN